MKEFNLEQNNKRKVNNTFNFDKIIDSLKYIKIDEENKIKIEGKIETINEIKNDIVFLEKRIPLRRSAGIKAIGLCPRTRCTCSTNAFASARETSFSWVY